MAKTLGRLMQANLNKISLETASGTFSFTHIREKDFDNLLDIFSDLFIDAGGNETIEAAEWLVEWGVKLGYLKETH